MTVQPSRRQLFAAAPAVVAIAALGAAVAAETAVDPVFTALDALKRAQARADDADEAYDRAYAPYDAALPKERCVTLGGVPIHTLEEFDRFSRIVWRPDDVLAAMRADMEKIVAAKEEADRRFGFSGAAEALGDAREGLYLAQIAVLSTKPTTAAGALALLDMIADLADQDPDAVPDFNETPAAIRAALAVLKREA